MFGPWEWVLIGLIAVLVFGPQIFIRAASSVGEGVSEFKKAAIKEEEGSERDESGKEKTES